MGGVLVADTSGTATMEKKFNGHASPVKTYFTMNGQHTVQIDGDTATGIPFSQLKMVRQPAEQDIITYYSVKYDDKYVCPSGKWLIKVRTAYFMIIEARPLAALQ